MQTTRTTGSPVLPSPSITERLLHPLSEVRTTVAPPLVSDALDLPARYALTC